MTSNFTLIMDELVSILREHFERTANNNNNNNITILSSETPDFSQVKLPVVSIYDVSFSSEQVGLGAGFGVSRQERKDQFSADGKQTTFMLSDEAVKPIVDVTIMQQYAEDSKARNMILNENEDFKVDYRDSKVIFRYPPQKGDNNVIVRYIGKRTVQEIKALRLKIRCFVDLWTNDLMQCNMMTEEIMKVLMDKEERLAASGINISSPEGINLLDKGNINNNNNNNNDSPNDADNVSTADVRARSGEKTITTTTATTISRPAFGRRLIYIAEAHLKVEKEIPTIKKIEIREKGEEGQKDSERNG